MYALLLLLPMTIYGLIEEDAMPRLLQDCYTTHALDQSNCLDQYLVHTYRNNTRYSIDQNALDWVVVVTHQIQNYACAIIQVLYYSYVEQFKYC
jgi:hypothetical protein